jgi:NAD(P)-dependent dehydrogenase (short-subunit alcohol dehydrogenase family)
MPTVLVTGANRGIGLEFARQYAAEGWSVIACCRSPLKAEALAGLGGDIDILPLDVTDEAQIRNLATALKGRPIDLLINNAGLYGNQERFGTTDTANWQNLFQVNCIAPVHLIERLLSNLSAGKQAKAISISTGMASIGDGPAGGSYAYRTSKAALNMAMANAAADLRSKLILAVLSPGWVQTDMGGTHAPVKVADSVAGMRRVIAGLTAAESGGFFNYDGRSLPW